jgi:hypothetical protein
MEWLNLEAFRSQSKEDNWVPALIFILSRKRLGWGMALESVISLWSTMY